MFIHNDKVYITVDFDFTHDRMDVCIVRKMCCCDCTIVHHLLVLTNNGLRRAFEFVIDAMSDVTPQGPKNCM